MRLLIARHGETEENLRSICQGQTAGTLTLRGVAQCLQLGDKLKGYPITHIYSSDQLRARRSAELMMSSSGCKAPLVLDERLRERFFGRWEGRPFVEIPSPDEESHEIETVEAIAERLQSFLHDLKQKHSNTEDLVLLMSHGFTMRVLEALLQGGPLDKVEEITFLPNGDYRLYEGGKLCKRPRVVYISGGQRSGKSGYAQRLARSLSDQPIYLATARYWDEDFERRIARHQADRGPEWTTIEEPRYLSQTQIAGRVVLIDCVTLWLTNIYSDLEFDAEASLCEARREWQQLLDHCAADTLIVVSNEIGMSLHAPDAGSRAFVDLQGWVNQYISATADEAYLMVSGRALRTELISDLYREESV